jgi:hypothetical protein
VAVVRERRRERERDHSCADELFVADRSIFGQERRAAVARQVAPEHRQVDGRVAPADVDPIDHACRAPVVADEHLPKVEVAVDDSDNV